MTAIILENISCKYNSETLKISCEIKSEGLPKTLWFEVKGINESSDKLLMNYNWAVVGLLLPAMKQGSDIFVKGCLSQRLHSSINNDLQGVLRVFQPSLAHIKVIAESVTSQRTLSSGRVGTGFSAGVDSFATLLHYNKDKDSHAINVTDICTFNVGAMGRYENPQVSELFDKYCKRSEIYAEMTGKNSITINSNLDTFYRGLNFKKTHTYRNVAAALCLEGYFDYYLYSSAYPLKFISIKQSGECAYLDPVALPMLSTENITFLSAMAAFSRVDKTRLLSNSKAAMEMLDVCVSDASERVRPKLPNCSTCWKCQRTLITLEALGVIESFGSVFDLELYEQKKRRFYKDLFFRMQKGDVLAGEVYQLAIESNLNLSITVTDHIVSRFCLFMSFLGGIAKSALFVTSIKSFIKSFIRRSKRI